MSKTAIVTLEGNTNFGNRLQNYALQEAITRVSTSRVETLPGLPRGEDKVLKARRRARSLVSGRLPASGRRGIQVAVPSISISGEAAGRRAAIDDFVASHIRTADRSYDRSHADEIARDHDFFVVGSDQVWNPAYTHGNAEWFLDFAAPAQRVAYAASFGIPEVPGYLRGRYRRGLNGLRKLSVREHSAARIVRELTGRHVPVVLDPTMLIEADDWRRLATRPPEGSGTNYVLVFMLAALDGEGVSPLAGVLADARHSGLEVLDANAPVDGSLLAWSPLDLLGAIEHADLVVTDSFHAAVFSHLFNTPFLISGRGAMNSRFDTLLQHSGLSDVWLRSEIDLERTRAVDWASVNERVALRRAESLDFLRAALRS